jgi:hypothetical protein
MIRNTNTTTITGVSAAASARCSQASTTHIRGHRITLVQLQLFFGCPSFLRPRGNKNPVLYFSKKAKIPVVK